MLKRFLLFILALLFCAAFSFAQRNITATSLGVNEGLSQNSIYSICQDKTGFMYFGSGNGLNRYDGKSIKQYLYRVNDTSNRNFPGRLVHQGMAEYQDALYMMVDGQIVSMDLVKESFSILSKKKYHVYDSDLIGIEGNKLIIQAAANEVQVFTIANNQVLPENTYSNASNAIISNGYLVWSTQNTLVRLNLKTNAKTQFSINNIVQISPYSGDTLLIKRGESYELLEPHSGFKAPTELATGINIRSLKSNKFLALDLKCHYQVLDQLQSFAFLNAATEQDSDYGCFITAIFLDRSQNLWIAKESRGLEVYDLKKDKFNTFPSATVSKSLGFKPLAKGVYASNDHIYLGTFIRGLYKINKNTGSYIRKEYTKTKKFQQNSIISFIKQDTHHNLWISNGTQIYIIDTATLKPNQSFSLGNSDGNDVAYSFCQVGDSTYWVGTYKDVRELILDKDGSIKQGRDLSQYPALQGYILNIEQDSDGHVYVSKHNGGYVKIDALKSKLAILEEKYAGLSIRDFYFTTAASKTVWMATDGGLLANTGEKSRMYDDKQGLANNYIYGILAKNDSQFWISTNFGLSNVQVEYKEDISIQSQNFKKKDGLQSNEFNTGSFYQAGDSLFVFGGIEGVNWFNPNDLIQNKNPPKVVITDIQINERALATDSSVSVKKQLLLSYKENNFVFHFAALDFSNPAANQYAYMLKGYDQDWIYSQNTNEARYNAVPPGNYTFLVRASNNDQVWSAQAQQLSIYIKPPFWRTNLFYFFMTLLSATIIFLIVRFYFRLKLQKKTQLLEQQYAVNEERNRISKDMHDELGTGLSKIALLSEVTRQLMHDGEQGRKLDQIGITSRQLTSKISEIIWTLNPKNDTLDNLCAFMVELFYTSLDELPVQAEVIMPDDIPCYAMSHIQRQQVILVMKEAMNNALKYSKCTTLTLILQLDQPYHIHFIVKDDGVGFDQSKTESRKMGKHNGLANMLERMHEMNGFCELKSTLGKGTEVHFGLELKKTP